MKIKIVQNDGKHPDDIISNIEQDTELTIITTVLNTESKEVLWQQHCNITVEQLINLNAKTNEAFKDVME